MNKLVLLLACGALLLAFVLTTGAAQAGLSFEDPQLCVNGKLLRVDPTTDPIEAFLKVGPDVALDYNIANCGGDLNLPTFATANVKTDGKRGWAELRVQTAPGAQVVITYGERTKMKSNGQGWVVFKKHLK